MSAALRQFHSVAARRAFTLLEMLVAVTLLTLIIVTLYGMFNVTQKAFRASVTQVDVMESGRAITEMIARELSQAAASHLVNYTNVYAASRFSRTLTLLLSDATPRDHELYDLFLLNHASGTWSGTAYFLNSASTAQIDLNLLNAGIGSLFRVEVNTRDLNTTNLLRGCNNVPAAAWQHLADGVVHFQIRAFNRSGNEIRPAIFTESELPAFFEVELGIMEPSLVAQLRSFPPTPPPASVQMITNYLFNGNATPPETQAGKVHLFRQRIPVRTAL